jgi:hypothetical protein
VDAYYFHGSILSILIRVSVKHARQACGSKHVLCTPITRASPLRRREDQPNPTPIYTRIYVRLR